MIIDGLFSYYFRVIEWFFDFIPDIDLSKILDTDFEPIVNYIKFITYFFPMQTVLLIVEINIAIIMFKIVISSLKTLWGILPVL